MTTIDPTSAIQRRAARIGFELPVRCKHGLTRSTVMLKDMTRFGARIEGLIAPIEGELVSLLLPDEPARMAFVMWSSGRSAGVEFGDPLPQRVFDALIRDYAIGATPPPPEEPRRAA